MDALGADFDYPVTGEFGQGVAAALLRVRVAPGLDRPEVGEGSRVTATHPHLVHLVVVTEFAGGYRLDFRRLTRCNSAPPVRRVGRCTDDWAWGKRSVVVAAAAVRPSWLLQHGDLESLAPGARAERGGVVAELDLWAGDDAGASA